MYINGVGHVERMTNERVAKTIYKWKPNAAKLMGSPRVRWEDDVRNDLRKIGCDQLETKDAGEGAMGKIFEQAKTHKEL